MTSNFLSLPFFTWKSQKQRKEEKKESIEIKKALRLHLKASSSETRD